MTYSIVFAGSADFGIPSLQALSADSRFSVSNVICNPAKPVGRKQELLLPPLGQCAQDMDIKVYTPSNKSELSELTKVIDRPDFLVVIAYGMIVPQEVLDWPKIAPINVHGSLLPSYRGASPIQSALLNGDTQTGNSIMKMSFGMDEGSVYSQSIVNLSGRETAGELFELLSNDAGEKLGDVLLDIANGLEPQPQLGNVSYCNKISKADGELDPSILTSSEIVNRYRAFTPWPAVFIFLEGQRIIIRGIGRILPIVDCEDLIVFYEDAVWLRAKDGLIELVQVQPEGKRVMSALDWWNGVNANKRA